MAELPENVEVPEVRIFGYVTYRRLGIFECRRVSKYREHFMLRLNLSVWQLWLLSRKLSWRSVFNFICTFSQEPTISTSTSPQLSDNWSRLFIQTLLDRNIVYSISSVSFTSPKWSHASGS